MLTIRMKKRVVKPYKTYVKGEIYTEPEWIALDMLNKDQAETVTTTDHIETVTYDIDTYTGSPEIETKAK